MKPITILIADDHTLIRETWSFILNTDPRFKVIAECSSGEEVIELVKTIYADIIMMDIDLPGINGIEATGIILKNAPETKILAVSQHSQPIYASQMMGKGAMGYVTKNSSHEEMNKALIEIYNGKKYICQTIKNNLSDQVMEGDLGKATVNSLTLREMEIIGFIREGRTSKEIAQFLFLAVKTVEVHRFNILKKLKLKNSSALVNFIHVNQIEFYANLKKCQL